MSCPFASAAAPPPAAAATGSDVHTITPLTGSMLSYGSYLKIDQLLQMQELESAKGGKKPAHDELLFIVIHQTYELWFKEILFEVDTFREAFMAQRIPERSMLKVVSGLHRVVEILKLLAQQITILDTMTPSGFMEFRDLLAPSSGFQSVQFRLLENKLGLKFANRVLYHNASYTVALSPEDRVKVEQSETEASLLEFVQAWLERTPGLEESGFNFWQKFCDGVKGYLADQRKAADLTPDPVLAQQRHLECEKIESSFATLLDPEQHEACMERGERRLSHKAFQGAMMITLYCEEPRFHLPFEILRLLTEVDAQIMRWRHNHVIMVQRMIGSKIGTGGSSGYQYLRATVSDRYKVFLDFNNLTTFILPVKYRPVLDDITLHRLAVSDSA